MNNGISDSFPISNEEYMNLDRDFGKLAKKQAWELLRKNTKNNHTDDFEDINQEVIIALLRAGSYYKRQVYIENCLEVAKAYVKDTFIAKIVEELDHLWSNRTRHGANRQKFGQPQEQLLWRIMKKFVPPSARPDKNAPLKIDQKFQGYCKAITWNAQKSMGRKITKEKSIRTGMASLSDFDYLGGQED